jgi:hypothetical protein
MNSSGAPIRRIAANLMWRPEGLVRNPLAEIGPDGRILRVDACPDPDRQPCTEFYAGLLVADFPADWRETFERLLSQSDTPLPELLARLPRQRGVPVAISGLDYATMRLTPRARIRRL